MRELYSPLKQTKLLNYYENYKIASATLLPYMCLPYRHCIL